MSTVTAEAQDRRVTIINDTGYTIVEFYGSNEGSDSWEEDILGTDVVPTGTTVNINFDDGSGYCMFDFKAVFSDGDVLERRGVDVCTTSTYTYQ
ncbi:hypothetical protein [Aliiroseovarius subalbicans]|uniref:hypothetical protein n=1 Tax=Aliiroseovarius subalbicans TaxID=2925840 RepID=UPI001F5AC16F|nr:hypothetical protein [Aliiroseovarius subalbicans]MCI2400445.1 hypothetical protein [Aliiroseovarius subalbicans]